MASVDRDGHDGRVGKDPADGRPLRQVHLVGDRFEIVPVRAQPVQHDHCRVGGQRRLDDDRVLLSPVGATAHCGLLLLEITR